MYTYTMYITSLYFRFVMTGVDFIASVVPNSAQVFQFDVQYGLTQIEVHVHLMTSLSLYILQIKQEKLFMAFETKKIFSRMKVHFAQAKPSCFRSQLFLSAGVCGTEYTFRVHLYSAPEVQVLNCRLYLPP